jgi:hypothetical protein
MIALQADLNCGKNYKIRLSVCSAISCENGVFGPKKV